MLSVKFYYRSRERPDPYYPVVDDMCMCITLTFSLDCQLVADTGLPTVVQFCLFLFLPFKKNFFSCLVLYCFLILSFLGRMRSLHEKPLITSDQ